MRFEVDIPIGGDSLADDECGSGELGRLLQVAQFAVLTNKLARVGDVLTLLDANGAVAGAARMVPDWAVDDLVWVTTPEGSLLKSVIALVAPQGANYTVVRCRYLASHELLSAVVVDHRGRDHKGRPVLARVPS